MLQDNIKNMRISRCLSQEEMAAQLHVVRQTVSKWEKGLSVPDSMMLIKIAKVFDVRVCDLLGEPLEEEVDINEVAQQLSKINEQLAKKNRRGKMIIRIVLAIILTYVLFNIVTIIVSYISMNYYMEHNNVTETIEKVSED